ncbi:MAG: hypothetical protein WC683_19985 [bacterium]|jgi:hypothetical protein
MIHSFNEQLAFSQSKEGAIDDIYKNYFKNVVKITRLPFGQRQRVGIDTVVQLASGEEIRTQEKWRTRPFSGDFLIETCSVWKNGECVKPGWIYTIDAEYIFAVYAPSQLVKIYPVTQLKLAWDSNKDDWMRSYHIPPARNRGYETHNIAVPCAVLESALLSTMSFSYQRQLTDSYSQGDYSVVNESAPHYTLKEVS